VTLSDLGLLFKAIVAAIPKAMADYKANKPLRPAQAITGAQAAAGARKFQTLLAQAAPLLEAHPGAITAAEDILDALDGAGFAWWTRKRRSTPRLRPSAPCGRFSPRSSGR
jgi:hypothetical protein